MNDIKQETAGSKSTPNIFNYATSELSQDAFILWLLDWANPENASSDKSLCETAQAFIRLLLDKKELEITSVKCKKQEHHIDVFAIINEQYALIIEDKTNTAEHGNQIKRYLEWVRKNNKYSNLELHCVYYKTGNESYYQLSQLVLKYSEDITTITRQEVLRVLSHSTTTNSIFNDYVSHLQKPENQTNAYLTMPINEWKDLAWQGFYLRLEKELGTGDWGYVANPSGGFWGFWWHWCKTTDPNIEIYLQFEQEKLCIKAYHHGNGKVEIKYSNKVKKAAKERNIPLEEKAKRRTGKTMTLAIVQLQNFETLNMPNLLIQLRNMEKFIDDISCIL